MEGSKKRKEIKLHKEVLDLLQQKAETKGWSLKFYIETLCRVKALEIKRDMLKRDADFQTNESNKKKK